MTPEILFVDIVNWMLATAFFFCSILVVYFIYRLMKHIFLRFIKSHRTTEIEEHAEDEEE
jgi:hypothetical protein